MGSIDWGSILKVLFGVVIYIFMLGLLERQIENGVRRAKSYTTVDNYWIIELAAMVMRVLDIPLALLFAYLLFK